MGGALAQRRWQLAITAGLVVFVVTLVGGYSGDWKWTGYSDNDTLWEWLKLLLLPVILATAPIWLTRGSEVRRDRRVIVAALALAFLVLVIVGYAANLRWTGFPGNKLWDWFVLIVLPLSIGAVRAWRKLGRDLSSERIAAIAAVAAAFGVFVAGGYALHWDWTGFQGNTLWDWIQLLLAPILFGIIVVPAASAWMAAEIEKREEKVEEREEEREAEREAEASERTDGTLGEPHTPSAFQ
jgi:hypothetical protein